MDSGGISSRMERRTYCQTPKERESPGVQKLLSAPGKVFNRVILVRLKVALDEKLREEQAGFRKGKSCADQIATFRIIAKQPLEWNSSLYVKFADFEKAFDSVDRESLCKLFRHFGVNSPKRHNSKSHSCRRVNRSL
ncbi:reverse transcriptase SR3-left [Elysia marginata]|uniref:Reverse transcriptase SR3-left n=1 Tax=Elysia marginata TaxID=1093978 RepID=A0AAV4HQW4_9GAST|nr:reverse transcriptase SR3-left [Elysia marginata]